MIVKEYLGQFSLGEAFKFVDDPRSPQGKLYHLRFLSNCAQLAILSGATGFRQNRSVDSIKLKKYLIVELRLEN